MIDFNQAKEMMITAGVNVAVSEQNGFVITNDTICLLNTIVIINQFKDIICNKLSEEQIEKLHSAYVNTIYNNLFSKCHSYSYLDNILNSCNCLIN